MSTDYDLYCVNCKCDAAINWNRGAADLASALKMRPALEAIGTAVANDDMAWRTINTVDNVFTSFFARHVGHEVRVRSEYGEFYTDCNARIPCVCGTTRYCVLPEKHVGEHSPTKPGVSDAPR